MANREDHRALTCAAICGPITTKPHRKAGLRNRQSVGAVLPGLKCVPESHSAVSRYSHIRISECKPPTRDRHLKLDVHLRLAELLHKNRHVKKSQALSRPLTACAMSPVRRGSLCYVKQRPASAGWEDEYRDNRQSGAVEPRFQVMGKWGLVGEGA